MQCRKLSLPPAYVEEGNVFVVCACVCLCVSVCVSVLTKILKQLTQKLHFWYGGSSWSYLGQVWVSKLLGQCLSTTEVDSSWTILRFPTSHCPLIHLCCSCCSSEDFSNGLGFIHFVFSTKVPGIQKNIWINITYECHYFYCLDWKYHPTWVDLWSFCHVQDYRSKQWFLYSFVCILCVIVMFWWFWHRNYGNVH